MRWLALLLVACLGPVAPLFAQDVRITGLTWFQSMDLRPLKADSIRASATTGTAAEPRTADGILVQCAAGAAWCHYLRSAERETTRPLLHDISLVAWGLGEGISFHAQGRARQVIGESQIEWPRFDDRFDLLHAYLDVNRPAFRARLGRQWTHGSLGAYNFDGASLVLRRASIDGEFQAGRALVQGLNEGYTAGTLLAAIEDIPPDDPAWLIGGRVRARAANGTAVSASYLRLLQDDRSGLYAERASVDLTTRAFGVRISANYAGDLASAQVNEARLRLGRDLSRHLDATVEARRHRPFFELWTIWGAFAPIGYDELRGSLGWRAGPLSGAFSGARRRYGEAGTGLTSLPLRQDGWRASGNAVYTAGEHFTAWGDYGVDIGFGASQSDGAFGLTFKPLEALEFGAGMSAQQTIYEFRIGTGRVIGGTAHAAWRVTDDLRIRMDGGLYSHELTNDAPGQDWSQRRLSARLEWAVGRDPGGTR